MPVKLSPGESLEHPKRVVVFRGTTAPPPPPEGTVIGYWNYDFGNYAVRDAANQNTLTWMRDYRMTVYLVTVGDHGDRKVFLSTYCEPHNEFTPGDDNEYGFNFFGPTLNPLRRSSLGHGRLERIPAPKVIERALARKKRGRRQISPSWVSAR